MITFRCFSCGVALRTADDKSNKRIKCPKCGAKMGVPAKDSETVGPGSPARPPLANSARSPVGDSDSLLGLLDKDAGETERARGAGVGFGIPPDPSEYQQEASAVAPSSPFEVLLHPADRRHLKQVRGRLILVAGGAVVLLVFGLVCWQALRDTWEKDHRDQIVAMEQRANDFHNNGRLEEALDECGRIFSLIAGRRINDPRLADAVKRAQDMEEETKKDLDIRNRDKYYNANKDAILGRISGGDAAIHARASQEACASYGEAIDLIRRAPYADDRLSEALRSAEAGQIAAKQEWERTVVSELDQMSTRARRALDNGAFDEAEREYSNLIEFERSNVQARSAATEERGTSARAVLNRIPGLRQQAQAERLSRLEPFQDKDGLWGYRDGTGRVVIGARWSRAEPFSEDLALVEWRIPNNPVTRGDYGYSGLVLPTYGHIDKTGKPAFKDLFHRAGSFRNGVARVEFREYWAAYHPKVTVDASGHITVEKVLLEVPAEAQLAVKQAEAQRLRVRDEEAKRKPTREPTEYQKAVARAIEGFFSGSINAQFDKDLYYRSNGVFGTRFLQTTSGEKFVVVLSPCTERIVWIDKTGKFVDPPASSDPPLVSSRVARAAPASAPAQRAAPASAPAQDDFVEVEGVRITPDEKRLLEMLSPKVFLKTSGLQDVRCQIDDEPAKASHGDMTFSIAPGQHTIRINAKGKSTVERRLDITRGMDVCMTLTNPDKTAVDRLVGEMKRRQATGQNYKDPLPAGILSDEGRTERVSFTLTGEPVELRMPSYSPLPALTEGMAKLTAPIIRKYEETIRASLGKKDPVSTRHVEAAVGNLIAMKTSQSLQVLSLFQRVKDSAAPSVLSHGLEGALDQLRTTTRNRRATLESRIRSAVLLAKFEVDPTKLGQALGGLPADSPLPKTLEPTLCDFITRVTVPKMKEAQNSGKLAWQLEDMLRHVALAGSEGERLIIEYLKTLPAQKDSALRNALLRVLSGFKSDAAKQFLSSLKAYSDQ